MHRVSLLVCVRERQLAGLCSATVTELVESCDMRGRERERERETETDCR